VEHAETELELSDIHTEGKGSVESLYLEQNQFMQ